MHVHKLYDSERTEILVPQYKKIQEVCLLRPIPNLGDTLPVHVYMYLPGWSNAAKPFTRMHVYGSVKVFVYTIKAMQASVTIL